MLKHTAVHICSSLTRLFNMSMQQNKFPPLWKNANVSPLLKKVVPHQRLSHKLDHYGIWGTTLNWIQNFLTNEIQKVVVDGSSSGSACVKSGVPQGTVLRPLLF